MSLKLVDVTEKDLDQRGKELTPTHRLEELQTELENEMDRFKYHGKTMNGPAMIEFLASLADEVNGIRIGLSDEMTEQEDDAFDRGFLEACKDVQKDILENPKLKRRGEMIDVLRTMMKEIL